MNQLSRLLGGTILAAVTALAGASANAAAPVRTVTDLSPYIVMDVATGAVLAEREADQPWYPASLTKLMTAYVTFVALADGQVTPATRVTESATAAAQEPVKMGFPVGTKMSLDNALRMMLVPSANDIAVAIAESVGGSVDGFASMMNDAAGHLGMTNTHFVNPNGLPDAAGVSSARDLATLAREIWNEFPDQRPLFDIQAIQSGDSVFQSPNLALLERFPGSQGMKTGFTCEAGYNLAAVATRNGRTLLAIVLGRTSPDDRTELAARLLNSAFAAPPATGDAQVTPAAYSEPASDPGPVDMRICTGSTVERVSFGDSVLGPVTNVAPPVRVVTDGQPDLGPSTPAKPKPAVTRTASAKSSGTTGTTSKATIGKPATTVASAESTPAAPVAMPTRTVETDTHFSVFGDDD